MSLDLLPLDILQHEILEKYFLWDKEGPVDYPLATTLFMLQYVNKRCQRIVSDNGSRLGNNLEDFRNRCNRDSARLILSSAAQAFGSVALTKWLQGTLKLKSLEYSINGAARGGHVKLLHWLESQGIPLVNVEPTSVVMSGNPEMITWALDRLAKQRHEMTAENLFSYALQAGKMELVKQMQLSHNFLRPGQSPSKAHPLLFRAALSGNTQLLQYCIDQMKIDMTTRLLKDLRDAALTEHGCPMLKLLHEKYQLPLLHEYARTAFENGYFDTLKYLFSKSISLPNLDSCAMFQINVEMLRWCAEKGSRFSLTHAISNTSCAYDNTSPKQLIEYFQFLCELYPKEQVGATVTEFPLTHFIPAQIWRMLGVKPKLHLPSLRHSAIISSSPYALDTVRFLVEEAQCTLPAKMENAWLKKGRKDVLTYVSAQMANFTSKINKTNS